MFSNKGYLQMLSWWQFVINRFYLLIILNRPTFSRCNVHGRYFASKYRFPGMLEISVSESAFCRSSSIISLLFYFFWKANHKKKLFKKTEKFKYFEKSICKKYFIRQLNKTIFWKHWVGEIIIRAKTFGTHLLVILHLSGVK